ncbi:MAG: DUF3108 domain-containing protein [Candidatus Omnitrophica bacterium]|nr:DUF3108 domain-containing protein [Candidatus Omnitrophota bacterium]MDD5552671.1 DUF3108 domain-containing protein [Candidatus Omnitrophota bacterium]
MIKKIALYFTILLSAAIILCAFNEASKNNPASIIKDNNLHDKLSQDPRKIVLLVNLFGLIPAAEATFEDRGIELYEGREVIHLSGYARPLNFIRKFFNARAEADSYMDKDKLHALRFRQKIIRPNKADEREIFYNQKDNFMEAEGVKRQILPDTHDPFSAIFYLRKQPLRVGSALDLNINTNQKNYQFLVKVTKREEYSIGSKKIGVWVLEAVVRRRDNNPYHKTTIKFWLLDNPSKTPILFKAMTNVGQVTARLTAIE